jgi:trimeric autotransporter adhesin
MLIKQIASTRAFGRSLYALLGMSALQGFSTVHAQNVFYACHVPLTGTVYRIKETNLKTTCTTGHVEFSWTDGANALRSTDPAGGDLSGVFSNAIVVRLLGRALSSTPPQPGQVLTWNGTEWAPTTPSPGSGGGTSDHGALTGLSDDDHPQYLLREGVRATVNGFAVTGTLNAGVIPTEGQGVRLMWYPAKAAFRAGQVRAVAWDAASVGVGSVAMGNNTAARGINSTALGSETSASGELSTALGQFSRAGGVVSTAMGNESNASGGISTAMGNLTDAFGEISTAMGDRTTAFGDFSTAMGSRTTADGNSSTAMGSETTASGDFTTAMGRHADTNGRLGAFVYGDASTTTDVRAPAANSFTVRAAGGTTFFSNATLTAGVNLAAGAGSWTSVSDVNRKHLFREESGESVLQKIAALSIRSWSYKSQDPSIRHLGPTAQDFRAAFGLGESELGISTIDIDGVNLLGVQALEQRTRTLSAENVALRTENAELRARLDRLEAALKELAGYVDRDNKETRR